MQAWSCSGLTGTLSRCVVAPKILQAVVGHIIPLPLPPLQQQEQEQ